jgi:hypothetical protein
MAYLSIKDRSTFMSSASLVGVGGMYLWLLGGLLNLPGTERLRTMEAMGATRPASA